MTQATVMGGGERASFVFRCLHLFPRQLPSFVKYLARALIELSVSTPYVGSWCFHIDVRIFEHLLSKCKNTTKQKPSHHVYARFTFGWDLSKIMILSKRGWGGILLAFPCQGLIFKCCSLRPSEGFHCSTVGGTEKGEERCGGGDEACFWSWWFLRAPVTSPHPSDLFIDFLRVYMQSPNLPASAWLFCGVHKCFLQGHHRDFSPILIFFFFKACFTLPVINESW